MLLCGHHHRVVHAHDVEILHDGRGRFRFQHRDHDTPMEPVLAMPGADPDATTRRREADRIPPPPPASTHPDHHGLDLQAAVAHVLQTIGMARPPGDPTTLAA